MSRWARWGLVVGSVACGVFDSGPPAQRRCDNDLGDSCFVKIPGGRFRLGAQAVDPSAPGYDPAARTDEGPVRTVRLASFWMQMHEARHSDWSACVAKGACPRPTGAGPVPGMGSTSDAAAALTWDEAKALCAFIGGRLPTGDEWEAAARGEDGRRFPWGNDPPCGLGSSHDRFVELPREAWTTVPGCETSAKPVTPRDRSPYKLVDMAWGQWEWVADEVRAGDIVGRVQRGGSWAADDVADHRVTARMVLPAATRVFDVGVRCAY